MDPASPTSLRSTPERLLTLNGVCRRLRIGVARLISAHRGGLLMPDFIADSGAILFRPARLGSIRELMHGLRRDRRKLSKTATNSPTN